MIYLRGVDAAPEAAAQAAAMPPVIPPMPFVQYGTECATAVAPPSPVTQSGRRIRKVNRIALPPSPQPQNQLPEIFLSETRVEDPVIDRGREGYTFDDDDDSAFDSMPEIGDYDSDDSDDSTVDEPTTAARVPELGTKKNTSNIAHYPGIRIPDLTQGYVKPCHLSQDECVYQPPPNTSGTVVRLKLLQLCQDACVPLTFHDDVLKIMKEMQKDDKFDACQDSKPRRTFIKELEDQFPGVPKAQTVKIGLENDTMYSQKLHENYRRGRRDEATVVTFDCFDQLMDMLTDKDIVGNLDNLVVNSGDDRWKPYQSRKSDDGTYHYMDEIHDGTWYQKAVENMEVDWTKNQFLCPLVLYLDKTGTTTNQRQPLEPPMICPSLFKRSIRNKPRNWRPIGYIPDLEQSSSAAKEDGNTTLKKMVSTQLGIG